jgi:hypothetical protein
MAESSKRDLQATLQEFIYAPGWAESRWILAMHPELLTDEADSLLSRIKASAREMGMTNEAEVADTHQRLLRLSRKIGSKAAFAQEGHDIPPLSSELLQLSDSAADAGTAFQTSGNEVQFRKAIETLEAGLREHSAQLEHAPLETVEWVATIAIGLRFESYRATGNPDDFMTALTYWENLLALASGSVRNLSAHTAGVAGGLLIIGHQAGLGTLPAAIEALEHAVSAGRSGPEREGAVRNLEYARSLTAKR